MRGWGKPKQSILDRLLHFGSRPLHVRLEAEYGTSGDWEYDSCDLLPLSLWCSRNNFGLVTRVYNALVEKAGQERLVHLNELAERSQYQYWQNVFPFIYGHYWGIINKSLIPEDVAFIPYLGLEFLHDSSLGMLCERSGAWVFFNITTTRRGNIFPPEAPIGVMPDLHLTKFLMSRDGWKTEMVG